MNEKTVFIKHRYLIAVISVVLKARVMMFDATLY